MKFRIVLLTILASVGFFNPFGMLSEQVQKLIFYICVFASIGLGMFSGVSLRDVKYPRTAFAILLISMFLSNIMASTFHMQSLKTSIITSLPYLMAYAFFYALMKLDISRDKIMNTYIVLCGISSVVYFCNVATMPNNMFGAPILGTDMTRGIIRIPVVFIEFFPMIVFYAINKWLTDKKTKWIIIIAVASLMIVLSVIRQIIAITAVLSIFFLLRNLSWKFKALISAAVVAIVIFVLPMIPIYNTMLELSEQQVEENQDEENIRITAWRYYTYENQTNALSPIFGNGMPSFGNSRWGIQFDSETQENGCYFVDVGWAGFFWVFGGVALASLLTMLYWALKKKKSHDMQYLNYWLMFLLFAGMASGPPIIYWQIIDIVVCFYLVFKKDDASHDECDDARKSASLPYSPYPQFGDK